MVGRGLDLLLRTGHGTGQAWNMETHMMKRGARICRLMAGLETPDDLTEDEQDHLHEDILQFLQEEHSKCGEEE